MDDENGLPRNFGPSIDPGPGIISHGPNTFWDCGRASDRIPPHVGPYYLYEIIGLILALVEAYGVISGNKGDSKKMLSEMNDKLDGIKLQLAEVNAKIEVIISMLRSLPLIIRGEIEDALLRVKIGEARAKVGQIQDQLPFVDQYIDEIRRDAKELDIMLSGIVGLRGMAGSIIVAPYFTTWLTAMIAVEKASVRAKPNWKILSPWSQDFAKRTKEATRSLLHLINVQDREYWAYNFPNHADTYDLILNQFEKNTQTVPPGPHGEYKFVCPTQSHPELIYAKKPGSPVYKEVREGPGLDAFQGLLRYKQGMAAFYELVPTIWQRRDDIMGVFLEPAGMWDINN